MLPMEFLAPISDDEEVDFSDQIVSRISVRGTLIDVHIENIRTRVEASNSTPYPVVRTVLDDRSLEHGKSVLRINQGSSAGYRRIRK